LIVAGVPIPDRSVCYQIPTSHLLRTVARPRVDSAGGEQYFRLTITRLKEMAMKWKTPVIIEIAVGLEINAYACAEVK
jgi:coenzyme PQQ precursor peptide PqqA